MQHDIILSCCSISIFFTVDHAHAQPIVFYRGIPVIIVRLLIVLYCTQTFYVKWDKCISTSFTANNGVRQGGILSPVLFNVFINELSNILNKMYVGCYVNSEPINHLFYADDSVILAPTPQALQKLLEICENYAKDVELLFNTKKSFCMAIMPKWLKDLQYPSIKLDGNVLQFVSDHKYLGILLNKDVYDDLDIKQQVRDTYAKGNMLISKFRKCDTNVKVKLFKTFCSNIYGCNLWTKYRKRAMNSLRNAHVRIFTNLFNVDDWATTMLYMTELGIDCIDVIIRKSAGGLLKRVCDSLNNVINSITTSLFFYESAIFKKWQDILFT